MGSRVLYFFSSDQIRFRLLSYIKYYVFIREYTKCLINNNIIAHLFFNSNPSDAKSVSSTSMVHFFLHRMEMFPRGSYHIFSNRFLVSKVFLASESVSLVSLNKNQSLVNNICLVRNNISLVDNILVPTPGSISLVRPNGGLGWDLHFIRYRPWCVFDFGLYIS